MYQIVSGSIPLSGKQNLFFCYMTSKRNKQSLGGTRKRRRVSKIKMSYDELFLKLSKSVHDTEYAHMIEDQILWLFVSDIAKGNLKQDEIFQIANKINKVIIEDRKNAGRWFA